MKLRLTIKHKFLEKLDATCFTSDDFDVVFGDDSQGQRLIDITFKHDESFVFQVKKEGRYFFISMKPGQIAEQEQEVVSSLAKVIEVLPIWAMEVRNEMKAGGSIYDEIDTLRELIAERLGAQSDDEEFSVEEINELKRKFTELENRVIELEKDKVITEKQLTEFKSGIEQVSDDIEYYPKKTWLKTAPNKLVKLVVAIGKSKEGRKLIADGARKLLGLD